MTKDLRKSNIIMKDNSLKHQFLTFILVSCAILPLAYGNVLATGKGENVVFMLMISWDLKLRIKSLL